MRKILPLLCICGILFVYDKNKMPSLRRQFAWQRKGFLMFIDPLYIVLVLPAVLFALFANFMVQSTFNRYAKEHIRYGLTGKEAARKVLDANGLFHVRIECISGNLTDHYDPRSDVIRLSEGVYHGSSPAAVGVAAHEAGHAIQHATGYFPIKVRSAIIPVTNLASRLAVPLILIGLLLTAFSEAFVILAEIGIICFSTTALFQLVTLPTEFNASRRAIGAIEAETRLTREEVQGAKKVLTAAAMTYVAALAVSLMQLLRLILLVGRVSGSRRRD